MLSQIQKETQELIEGFLEAVPLVSGDLFVVGCSTSEAAGGHIGKSGSLEIAAAIFDGLYPILQGRGIYLAAQCCEHLNRALVVERETAIARGFDIVSAVPYAQAGGAFAATAWGRFDDPVLAETIRAQGGIDIGGTLIGMHLAHVAVPVRVSRRSIGAASVVCAYTRPKLIGGERTR